MSAEDIKKGKKVTIEQLVGSIKKKRPMLLSDIPQKKAVRIVQAVLAQIDKRLETVNEGVMTIPGFGAFRVRQIEREKDGKKEAVRRVVFRAAKPKVKKEKDAEDSDL